MPVETKLATPEEGHEGLQFPSRAKSQRNGSRERLPNVRRSGRGVRAETPAHAGVSFVHPEGLEPPTS